MTLEELLKAKREEILRVCARYGAHNVRVFGSVARGEADEQGEIDLLVEFKPGRTLLDHAFSLHSAAPSVRSRTSG
jgi:predicted nucleotidyltransferase